MVEVNSSKSRSAIRNRCKYFGFSLFSTWLWIEYVRKFSKRELISGEFKLLM